MADSLKITHRAAVLGSPIAHSLSPVLHNSGYAALGLNSWEYNRFECTETQLPDFLSQSDPSYRGFSVTMPGKIMALRIANEDTPRARAIGAANTLIRTATGWCADNTDVAGISGCLKEIGITAAKPASYAVVIGAGGTSRPAIWALGELGFKHIIVLNRSDRSSQLAPLLAGTDIKLEFHTFAEICTEPAALAQLIAGAAVLISTVPAAAIEPYIADLAHAPVVDVIYDPWPTPLTVHAAANGYLSAGGHIMLAYQAFEQFELFTGYPAPREAMRQALYEKLGLTSALL
ncbi:shikimate dehydrogenase [Corynebacterium caspium]|uniref:shikimate dehydrogenase n=1 Tax=Corynebacterium caspium TaxID=234828 RepID=UPI0003737979|nr:shikimate dehydrogenase [Corynebacterium caspium]WKD59200.1 Shikimate dehydrogenase [Corynebacterium caspium DSM 44850]